MRMYLIEEKMRREFDFLHLLKKYDFVCSATTTTMLR